MNLTNHISAMMATARMHDAEAKMQNVNEVRFGLANKAHEGMSQPEVASLAQQDKALALAGAQAQTNYLVSMAMLEAAQRRQLEEKKLKERLMEAGSLYP